jgi:hypothetical protein
MKDFASSEHKTDRDSGDAESKIEIAGQLLKEAHEELESPDNSLIGPAIDQIEAHRERTS